VRGLQAPSVLLARLAGGCGFQPIRREVTLSPSPKPPPDLLVSSTPTSSAPTSRPAEPIEPASPAPSTLPATLPTTAPIVVAAAGDREPAAATVPVPASGPKSVTASKVSRYRTAYLAERDGWYMFVRRYPRVLRERGLFAQDLCRISLRTRDLSIAQRLARALAHRFDEVMQRLGQYVGSSPPADIHQTSQAGHGQEAFGTALGIPSNTVSNIATDTVSDTVPKSGTAPRPDSRVAARFEALLCHADIDGPQALARLSDEPTGTNAPVPAPNHRQAVISPARELGVRLQLVDVVAPPQASASLAQLEAYRELCRQMMSGHLQAMNLVLQRLDGSTAATLSASPPASMLPVPPVPPPVLRPEDDYDDLAKALEHWVVKARPAPKTIMELRPVWARLQQVTGKSRISALTREDIMGFQASELARMRGGEPTRPQTVNKKLALLAAVFNLVHDDVLESRGIANPMRKLKKAKVRGDDYIDKQDYSTEELLALFGGPVHRDGHRPKGGAGEAAYWMPLLGYAMGCRQSELAQVATNEVLQRDGVWCIWLTSRQEDGSTDSHDGDRGDESASGARRLRNVEAPTALDAPGETAVRRSQKTGFSRRIIPLHPELLRLGFLDYVAWLRARREVRLFPAVRPDNKGTLAGNFSKWFNGYLRKVGIKRRGLDWISFRHSLKTACRSAGIEQDMADYIEGHASSRASQSYGRFTTTALKEAISRIELPGLRQVPTWAPPNVPARAGRQLYRDSRVRGVGR